jgi:hypothetical protein
MANTPKKMKDPTEAALSAIQDALHIRDDQPSDQNASAPLPVDGPPDAPWPGLRSSAASSKSDVYADENRRPDDSGTPRRPAANDDQESIGNILRAIQRRPSSTSYMLASIFAGVWVVGGFLLGWL